MKLSHKALFSIDLNFKQLSGKTMEDLYWIIGLAFPDTSPYKLSGRLLRTDGMWRFENFAGKVGESDLAGTLQVDTGGQRPYMHGDCWTPDSEPIAAAKLPGFVALVLFPAASS